MTSTRRRRSARAGRPPMYSRGRPPVARREHQQQFWRARAAGASSEDAGKIARVSPAVGTHGGVTPVRNGLQVAQALVGHMDVLEALRNAIKP